MALNQLYSVPNSTTVKLLSSCAYWQPPSPFHKVYRNRRHFKPLLAKLLAVFILVAIIHFLFPIWRPTQQVYEGTGGKSDREKIECNEFQINFKNIHMPFWMDMPPPPQWIPMWPTSTNTKLLILIMTRRGALDKRLALRQTWLKDLMPGTVTKFVIADAPPSVDMATEQNYQFEIKSLELEQGQFGDLVIIHGILDAYSNLHLKWNAALQWQQAFCPQAEWIVKTDDDTVVHLPRLDYWIERQFRAELTNNSATYFGYVISGVGPIRDPENKWYVPKSVYPDESYPPYMQGATYLASRQAIDSVLKHTSEVNGFNMDDVLFTGILAKLANVSLSHQQKMFRVGNQLDKVEDCDENGMPYATSLYGANSLEEYTRIYATLKSINCVKSTFTTEQPKEQD